MTTNLDAAVEAEAVALAEVGAGEPWAIATAALDAADPRLKRYTPDETTQMIDAWEAGK